MAEPTDVLVIGPDGSVLLAGRGAGERLAERAGRYALVADAPGLLVLRESGASVRVQAAGELLSRTAVLEIVNMVAQAGWRGELHIVEDESHRMLGIEQGTLTYAWSDHPDDRLGQVLYRNGAITRAQLDEILEDVGPERRIGQLLFSRGHLSQERLFTELQKQVEQIFYASMLARSGHYAFVVPDEASTGDHHHVHLSIQAMLMEGVQRIDEMALFRDRIPNDDLCPVATPKAVTMTLDANARLVLTYADGQRTIEQISRETGLGQFMTVKTVYGLLQQGGVQLKPKKDLDARAIKLLVRQFNEVLRDIFMAVATYGGIDQTRQTLEAWIQGSGYGPVFGDHLYEDGSLSADQILHAMGTVEADNPTEALHQALHELAAFALFAATTTLPRDQESVLSRDVNSRLKRIRIS
ncbi:MAG: DUF4388 domain-containing protein [Sandaracinaceae bacterium]